MSTHFFLDNFLWFEILIFWVIFSIPFFKCLLSRRILPLRLSQPVKFSKSRKYVKKPSCMLISPGSQSPLRNTDSCTEPSETVGFFCIHRLMFSHQFIDWAEDATSILIEQNGMWVCDVGDCVWLLPSLYTKSEWSSCASPWIGKKSWLFCNLTFWWLLFRQKIFWEVRAVGEAGRE